jgi:hypothetical protein
MVEGIHNLDLFDIDPMPTKIYDELNWVLGEARYSEQRGTTGGMTENTLAGPSNRMAPWTTVKDYDSEEKETWSKQISLALMEDIHPGYPYRENINNNDDLP